MVLSLPAQIEIPLGVNFLEEIVGQVVDEVDAFAGRFHFGAEFLVYIREFAEREHRNLDRVALLDRVEREVGDFSA